jgi:hypothetical protein
LGCYLEYGSTYVAIFHIRSYIPYTYLEMPLPISMLLA